MTRARAQASALAERLRELGATTVEAPAIRTQPLDAELPPVKDYDLLCVTSPMRRGRMGKIRPIPTASRLMAAKMTTRDFCIIRLPQ